MLKSINNKEDCHLTATRTTTYAATHKKIKRKFYKPFLTDSIRMFPSDPSGSLDDFILLDSLENFVYLGGVLWKKH